MNEIPRVIQAEPHDDHTLTLTFEGGARRLFDFKPCLQTEVFAPLHDLDLFRQVNVVYGSLEWPGARDLAYDMLFAESTPLSEVVE